MMSAGRFGDFGRDERSVTAHLRQAHELAEAAAPGNASFDRLFDLRRNAKAMNIPVDPQMADDPASLVLRERLPDVAALRTQLVEDRTLGHPAVDRLSDCRAGSCQQFSCRFRHGGKKVAKGSWAKGACPRDRRPRRDTARILPR